jgi:nanoRNase/pAp phosphatase (c-di-AMP/oligoRNAs hydrolase)
MRLITRADFDGLACGALLMELGVVDNWIFVHPKDVQDGKIKATKNDVLTNVPYIEGCGLWFDHHASETERVGATAVYEGASYQAPSAARIVFDYYGGRNRLPYMEEMVAAVDKVDSGQLSMDEIVNPHGWVLLGFIMDPRTGLGRHKKFTVGNVELMEELMDSCRDYDIDQLLMLPDVAERVEFYHQQTQDFNRFIAKYSGTDGEIIITDLRGKDHIPAGNRFYLYSMFPIQNISIWIVDGFEKQNCSIAIGHSIVNRTSKVNVGHICLQFGGGGHYKVGTCQVPYVEVDDALKEIIKQIHEAEYE